MFLKPFPKLCVADACNCSSFKFNLIEDLRSRIAHGPVKNSELSLIGLETLFFVWKMIEIVCLHWKISFSFGTNMCAQLSSLAFPKHSSSVKKWCFSFIKRFIKSQSFQIHEKIYQTGPFFWFAESLRLLKSLEFLNHTLDYRPQTMFCVSVFPTSFLIKWANWVKNWKWIRWAEWIKCGNYFVFQK